ncbi:hypothetical protein HS125_09920 [bacterium]|nr:hypothetical protein [bacterium]
MENALRADLSGRGGERASRRPLEGEFLPWGEVQVRGGVQAGFPSRRFAPTLPQGEVKNALRADLPQGEENARFMATSPRERWRTRFGDLSMEGEEFPPWGEG